MKKFIPLIAISLVLGACAFKPHRPTKTLSPIQTKRLEVTNCVSHFLTQEVRAMDSFGICKQIYRLRSVK